MISKKQLTKHLEKLSSNLPSSKGEMPSYVWQQFLEYMLHHYRRFDKKARAYADEVFDQVEVAVQRTIEALPEGLEKERLIRKLARVRGERSPIPVLYLDTPVLESVIQHAFGQPISERRFATAKILYKTIPVLVKDRKLVYAEDNLHRETLLAGGYEGQKALDIIRTFSEGMSFRHIQAIEDYQVFRSLRGFINGSHVDYRAFWKDALQSGTVHTIMKKRPFVAFEEIVAPIEKPGVSHALSEDPKPFATRLRIRYDQGALNNDQETQNRSTRHLRDLVRLGMRYQNVVKDRGEPVLDGFWDNQKTDMALAVWNYYGGDPVGLEGLISFYDSEHFRKIPAIKIKQDVWNACAENDPRNKKTVTAAADMSIIASVMPYSDIMILSRGLTEVVRDKLKLDAAFDVEVLAQDEHERVLAALDDIASAQ